MKQGDSVPVTIAGITVANATVKEVGDGEVTIVVPGTIVRMATRTQLAPEDTVPEGTVKPEPTVEHQILGVDNSSGAVAEVVKPLDGGTPEVVTPPITAPSEPSAPAQDAAIQSVEQAVEQLAPAPDVAPTVADKE